MTALSDAALEESAIDRNEFGVLRALASPKQWHQQALATHLGIDTTTMVALIDALETRGALTRRPDPADRRRNVIELTPDGRTLCARAEAAYADAEERFLAPLGSKESTRFRAALRTLATRDLA